MSIIHDDSLGVFDFVRIAVYNTLFKNTCFVRLLKEKTRINEKCHVNLNSKIGVLSYYCEQSLGTFKNRFSTSFLRCFQIIVLVISGICAVFICPAT